MTRPTVGDLSLAIACLPHAGYRGETYTELRRLLLAALGDRPLEAVACQLSPAYARELVADVVTELAACVAQEVAA